MWTAAADLDFELVSAADGVPGHACLRDLWNHGPVHALTRHVRLFRSPTRARVTRRSRTEGACSPWRPFSWANSARARGKTTTAQVTRAVCDAPAGTIGNPARGLPRISRNWVAAGPVWKGELGSGLRRNDVRGEVACSQLAASSRRRPGPSSQSSNSYDSD
jgi:hypothetical protein